VVTVFVQRYVCVGWFWPMRVASSSMAPNLLGPHAQRMCPNCGELVVVDASHGVPRTASCFNCGTELARFAASRLLPGSRVLIDRWTARRVGPQRFDVVAFTAGDGDDEWLVKRAVGLPGETVEIADGDIVIDSVCARKNAAQFLGTAILVFADRSANYQRRWSRLTARSERSHWDAGHGTWSWERSATFAHDSTDEIDWLDYHHQASPRVVGSGTGTQQILDEYGYNQTESRALHVVPDVACTVAISIQGTGAMCIETGTPVGPARLSLVDGKPPSVTLNGHSLLSDSNVPAPVALRGPVDILFGYWDRQLVYRIGSATEFQLELEDTPPRAASLSADVGTASQIMSLGVQGNLKLSLKEFLVWRDIYYFADPASRADHRFALGPDEYALLGDNTPVSDDARYSTQQGIVGRNRILGTVTRIH
jgi:signal peptidase I